MKQSDAEQDTKGAFYITQGEFLIGTDPTCIISTILGSCIATCLWDPIAQVGGMNHFLLPNNAGDGDEGRSFGAHSMELLINGLLRAGASKDRLRAKVFGGAQMYKGLTSVGAQNGAFALNYLQCENIPCDAQSIGGTQARRIKFYATTGLARQKLVEDKLIEPAVPVQAPEPSNDLELF